mgnify:CR=1 FL=1
MARLGGTTSGLAADDSPKENLQRLFFRIMPSALIFQCHPCKKVGLFFICGNENQGMPMNYDYHNDTATSMVRTTYEEGFEITISKHSLMRLTDMLKSKGYYHDEDYRKRIAEEELILTNPALKQLHDQYKMYLYMLCGDEYKW